MTKSNINKEVLKHNMQKRGQTEVLTITLLFEVLAGFLLAGILIYAVLTTGNVEGFTVNYLKSDHDLLISTLKTVPGDVELEYSTGGYYYEDGNFYKGSFNKVYSLEIKKEDGKITEKSK